MIGSLPIGRWIWCFSRSTVKVGSAAVSASWISRSTWSLSSTIGRMPFLKQLLWKMSAKLGAMTQRMPKSSSAQGACSRELPQPKLSPAIRIWALRQGSRFSMNSGCSTSSSR